MAFTVDEILERSKEAALGVTFEEALKRTQFGKFHYFLIFIAGVFMSASFYEIMGVNYILPIAECDLNITSKQQYGIVSGIWFAGIIISSHLWGFLSDTYGRQKILRVASLSAFGFSVCSSLAVNLWQMALFRLFNGLCLSGATGAVFAYLGEFLDAKTRSRSMMISCVIFAGFCLFLPVMAWLLINQSWNFVIPIFDIMYKPWRLFLLACGLPSLFSGLIISFFPESPKFTFSQGDERKTMEIFQRIHKINTGLSDNYNVYKIKPNEEFYQSSERKNVMGMMKNQLVTLVRDYPRSIALVSIIQFGINFVCTGILLFFPDIVNQTARFMQDEGSDEATLCQIVENSIKVGKDQMLAGRRECVDELDLSAYSYAFILEGCYFVGFIVVSMLVNYIGRLSIFSFVFFSTGLSGILIVFINNATVGTYLYVWLLVCGVNNTLLNTVTYDLFPTNLRSLAMSLSLMVGRLGSLTGGNVAGFMLEGHCTSLFVVSSASMIACGLLTFLIPNIIRKK